jgi:hypothetical protein
MKFLVGDAVKYGSMVGWVIHTSETFDDEVVVKFRDIDGFFFFTEEGELFCTPKGKISREHRHQLINLDS